MHRFKIPTTIKEKFEIHFHTAKTAATVNRSLSQEQIKLLEAQLEAAKKSRDQVEISAISSKLAELKVGDGLPDEYYPWQIGDASPEALGSAMLCNDGRIYFCSSESSVFESLISNPYSNKSTSSIHQAFLHPFDANGGDIVVVRANNKRNIKARNVRGTFQFAAQTNVLIKIVSQHRDKILDTGLMSRFLFFIGQRQPHKRTTVSVDSRVTERFEREWQSLLSDLASCKKDIEFCPEAIAEMESFASWMDEQDCSNGRDALNARPGRIAVRLAGILHFLHYGQHAPPIVSAKTAQLAIEILRHSFAVSEYLFFGRMRCPNLDKWEEVIRYSNMKSIRDIKRSSLFGGNEITANITLNQMEEAGIIQTVEDQTGGRPSPKLVVHPTAMEIIEEVRKALG